MSTYSQTGSAYRARRTRGEAGHENRIATPAVTMAFSFWPASAPLRGAPAAQPGHVVGVEAVDLPIVARTCGGPRRSGWRRAPRSRRPPCRCAPPSPPAGGRPPRRGSASRGTGRSQEHQKRARVCPVQRTFCPGEGGSRRCPGDGSIAIRAADQRSGRTRVFPVPSGCLATSSMRASHLTPL